MKWDKYFRMSSHYTCNNWIYRGITWEVRACGRRGNLYIHLTKISRITTLSIEVVERVSQAWVLSLLEFFLIIKVVGHFI